MPTGRLLVNTGTPASTAVSDVRRYLREFLSDPRVIDIPAPARWLLLNDARRLDRQTLPLMIERFAALAEDPGASLRPLADVALRVDATARAATLQKLGLSANARTAVLCPGAEYGPAKRWPVAWCSLTH